MKKYFFGGFYMGKRSDTEKEIINKIMKYIIIKQIADNGFIKSNTALNKENNKLCQAYDLLHQPKQPLEIEQNTFDGRYQDYCKNNYRFKVALPHIDSYSHILLFPIDVLFLYKERKLKLSPQQILFLTRPKYHYNNAKQLITLKVRFQNYAPYLEKYLSTSKRIYFVSKSLNEKGYLLQFNKDENYDYFKSALTNRKYTKERRHELIQKKLEETSRTWLEPLQEHYRELHTNKLNELKKSFDFEIPD